MTGSAFWSGLGGGGEQAQLLPTAGSPALNSGLLAAAGSKMSSRTVRSVKLNAPTSTGEAELLTNTTSTSTVVVPVGSVQLTPGPDPQSAATNMVGPPASAPGVTALNNPAAVPIATSAATGRACHLLMRGNLLPRSNPLSDFEWADSIIESELGEYPLNVNDPLYAGT